MSKHISATMKRYNSNGAPKRLRSWVLVCLGLLLCAVSSTFGATFAVTEEELDALFVQAPDKLVDVAGLPHKTEEGRTYVQVGDSFLMTKYYGGIEAAFGGSLWPNGTVYYVFDTGVSATNRQLFLSAAGDWSATAKLTFVELSSVSGNCILVRNDDTSNFSSVIGMGGGTQTIAIHNWQEFIVAHEIGHALGLIHEQCRSDRDSFVTIEWQNIPSDSDTQYQFRIQTASLYGAYDFDSVMHYSQCSFTICSSCTSSCHTITVKPPNDSQWQSLIGQSSHLSDLDRSGMAQRYGNPDGGGSQELVTNGNFEAQYTGWTVNTGDILAGNYPHGGSYYAYLGNRNDAFGNLYTTNAFTIPSNATSATLSFWLNITSEETENVVYDTMNVSLLLASGGSVKLATYSNLNKDSGAGNPYYSQRSFDVTAYKGQSVKVYFDATTDPHLITTFRIDDVSIKATLPTTETISTSNRPSGTTNGQTATSYSYSTGGSSSNLGHIVQYQFDWGDGTTSAWLAVGSTSTTHNWPSAGTYLVKAHARCSNDTGIVSSYSNTLSVTITVPETISSPNTPTGSSTGSTGTSYAFSSGGSSSSLGHSVQYQFDWGDGSVSGWLGVGTTSASHSWSSTGSYSVKVQARCSTHTSVVSSSSAGLSVSISVNETVSTPAMPSGPSGGTPGTSYSYSTGGASSNLGHSVQYQFGWGDGSSSGWLAVGTTSASHIWSSAGTYSVMVQARCSTHTSVVSGSSGALSVTITNAETISAPSVPNGPSNASPGVSYNYSTGGAASNLGHPVQYQFNWGDGSTSGWLASGTTSASHTWPSSGTYSVTVQARCATHTSILSSLSGTLSVKIFQTNSVAKCDFDGNGFPDLIWQSTGTSQVYLWFMDGHGNAQSGGYLGNGTNFGEWKIVGSEDLNGDGKTDLIWRSTITNQVYLWFMDGHGNAQGGAYLGNGTNFGEWRLVATGDLNGDGKPDVIWQSDSTNQVYIWFMDGHGNLQSGGYVGSGTNFGEWKVVGAEDLNSDGKVDLIWRSTTTNQIYIWFMDGRGNFQSGSYLGNGTNFGEWKLASVEDLNGDGKPDLIWQSSTTNQVYVWYMDGHGNFQSGSYLSSAANFGEWKIRP